MIRNHDEDCPYNPAVQIVRKIRVGGTLQLEWCDGACFRCGWDPDVSARRIKEIRKNMIKELKT